MWLLNAWALWMQFLSSDSTIQMTRDSQAIRDSSTLFQTMCCQERAPTNSSCSWELSHWVLHGNVLITSGSPFFTLIVQYLMLMRQTEKRTFSSHHRLHQRTRTINTSDVYWRSRYTHRSMDTRTSSTLSWFTLVVNWCLGSTVRPLADEFNFHQLMHNRSYSHYVSQNAFAKLIVQSGTYSS